MIANHQMLLDCNHSKAQNFKNLCLSVVLSLQQSAMPKLEADFRFTNLFLASAPLPAPPPGILRPCR